VKRTGLFKLFAVIGSNKFSFVDFAYDGFHYEPLLLIGPVNEVVDPVENPWQIQKYRRRKVHETETVIFRLCFTKISFIFFFIFLQGEECDQGGCQAFA
jgi:hypothetical protein